MEPSFFRLLHEDRPGDALRRRLLAGRGPRLSFLADAPRIPAGPRPYHSGSVLDHLARCMNAVAGAPLAVWMALAHDAGKLTTPAALWPHHYGHELRGALLAAVWAAQLRLPKPWRRAGCMTARLHMKAGRYAELRAATRYDLLREVAAGPCPSAFWRVVDADSRKPVSAWAGKDWEGVQTLPLAGLSEEQARQAAIARLTERPAAEATPPRAPSRLPSSPEESRQ